MATCPTFKLLTRGILPRRPVHGILKKLPDKLLTYCKNLFHSTLLHLWGSPCGSAGNESTCTLFIIARTWKQPRCPSADEWIRKLWYIYTMEYYSAIKNNSFESVLMRWMKLEPIIQSEVSQKDKDQCSIPTHIYGI